MLSFSTPFTRDSFKNNLKIKLPSTKAAPELPMKSYSKFRFSSFKRCNRFNVFLFPTRTSIVGLNQSLVGKLLLSLLIFARFARAAVDWQLNLPTINFNGFGLLSANIVQIITIILLVLIHSWVGTFVHKQSFALCESSKSHPSYSVDPM